MKVIARCYSDALATGDNGNTHNTSGEFTVWLDDWLLWCDTQHSTLNSKIAVRPEEGGGGGPRALGVWWRGSLDNDD